MSRSADDADELESAAVRGEKRAPSMRERIRDFDWSCSPLGSPEQWPQSLRIALRIMLDSRYAMWLGWGPDFIFFYNDAYAAMTLGPKHPWALGRPAREVWSEIWDEVGPRARSVIDSGKATWDERLLLFLERQGFAEETYHTFSYSPIPDDSGAIGGMLCVVTEDTQRTIGERRLRTLRELAARTTDEARTANEACELTVATLAENGADIPFVLIYLVDGDVARLAGEGGLPAGSAAAPSEIPLGDDALANSVWPLATVQATGRKLVVDNVRERFGAIAAGRWSDPIARAVVLPVARSGQPQLAGFLVAAVSPRLALDDAYLGFFDLLAGHVAASVSSARAYEEERRRAEALAELDRAKTTFFSNVSHEFRTPLALMLGPVEQLLARGEAELAPDVMEELSLVSRNGGRLLRLVNTLLDFSRIEAGRIHAVYHATDLAAFTAELASVFRSACERAGLRLTVTCPPLDAPVYVDREMWEKIVLNLLSNALKFTFEGEIAVTLRAEGRYAALAVRDTGVGIPAAEMPRLFERFHRIANARGRTHEGSGIGLALVQELAHLHGGTVTASSTPGEGTTFTVRIPLGNEHLPSASVVSTATGAPTATAALPYIDEALRWLPDATPAGSAVPPPERSAEDYGTDGGDPAHGGGRKARVLVVDDNHDMRHYMARLLSARYEVRAAPDGVAALDVMTAWRPDLVLSDVMMPRLDGFGLLRAMRAEPRVAPIPVVLISARAGDESRVEGVEAGADDYLVKPFSARELLARVAANLQLARMRREANDVVRRSEEHLRLVTDNAPVLISHFDAERSYTFVNAAYSRFFEIHPWQAIGRPIREVLGDDAYTKMAPHVETALAGKPIEFEVEATFPHAGARVLRGAFTPERDGATVAGVVAALMDITDQKRVEVALRQKIEEMSTLLDTLPIGVFIAHDADATQITGNAAAHLLLRTGRSNLSKSAPDGEGPQHFRVFQDGVELRPEEMPVQRAARGEEIRNVEVEDRFDDGTVLYTLMSAAPLFDESGKARGAIATVLDVTERRRALEALQDSDRRKSEFLATLAHELRNPLAPLLNGLQLMRLAAGNEALIEQSRTMMERQLAQLVRLVDDLLDVSRISQGKLALRPEPVDIATVLASAVETSRPVIDEMRHSLQLDVPDAPIMVNADLTRLAQVFMNLLNNAAKYSEPGGEIVVTVTGTNDEVSVSVRDRGIGIAAEQLPAVFDMFSQVEHSIERSRGGLGIGLSLVQRLVEMHGGRIEVHSDGPGCGSEFVVNLPRVVHDVAPSTERAPEPPSADAARRILVVDDNRDGAETLSMILALAGYETRVTHDGLDALDEVARFHPDVILLDIGLPKLNGHDVCRRVRSSPGGDQMVIVALTGWGQDEDRLRSNDAGFDHHLVKPVEPASLIKLLAGPLAR